MGNIPHCILCAVGDPELPPLPLPPVLLLCKEGERPVQCRKERQVTNDDIEYTPPSCRNH